MTPAQLDLARWLAGSDAWRQWCEEHSGEANAIRWVPYPSVPGQVVPDITSPLMVGPLIEMLRDVTRVTRIGSVGTTSRAGEWACHLLYDPTRTWIEPRRNTDAEALCALLREVSS